jgi:hypothetical protein
VDRLRDRRIQIIRRQPHHQSTKTEDRIICRQTTRRRNAIAERRPDGHAQRHRGFHGAGNSQHLLRDGLTGLSGSNVHESLDVVHHYADCDGNAARRNQFAGDVVHQIVFVARGIIIPE